MNDAQDRERYRQSERRGREMQIEFVRKMRPEQRLRVAEMLCVSAREIKAGALRSRHPDWTEEQVQEEVRRRFFHVGR